MSTMDERFDALDKKTDDVLELLQSFAAKLDQAIVARQRTGRTGQTADPAMRAMAERHIESTDARRLFEEWVKAMGKNPTTTKFTAERRRAVVARLADYSPEFIRRAIYGCAASDFHTAKGEYKGGKRYDDLTLICRNGSKLEQFEAMFKDPEAGRKEWLA